jgi:hypothetical protein
VSQRHKAGHNKPREQGLLSVLQRHEAAIAVLVSVAALAVSAVALWVSWSQTGEMRKQTTLTEQQTQFDQATLQPDFAVTWTMGDDSGDAESINVSVRDGRAANPDVSIYSFAEAMAGPDHATPGDDIALLPIAYFDGGPWFDYPQNDYSAQKWPDANWQELDKWRGLRGNEEVAFFWRFYHVVRIDYLDVADQEQRSYWLVGTMVPSPMRLSDARGDKLVAAHESEVKQGLTIDNGTTPDHLLEQIRAGHSAYSRINAALFAQSESE